MAQTTKDSSIVEAVIREFKWDRLFSEGRSFGFAEVMTEEIMLNGMPFRIKGERVFVGTEFRTMPVIEKGVVVMGPPGATAGSMPISQDTLPRNSDLVIDIVCTREGLQGCWCRRSEWDALKKSIADATKKEESDLDRALAAGWKLASGYTRFARCVRLTKTGEDGRVQTLTITQTKSEVNAQKRKAEQKKTKKEELVAA